MCARNVLGGEDNPHLPLVDLSLADVKTIFPPQFVAQLDKVFACGNYGDPIAAPDLLEVLQYFREANPKIRLGLNTNASARRPEWWAKLGALLSGKGDYCKFGIDGLADTNHLYRKGTNFDKIIENAKAFISAGGVAHWDYIVFKHNEHQIEEAEALSKELGFQKFQVKKTGRFFSNTKMQGKDEQPVRDRDGNITHVLEKPTNPRWQNNALVKEGELVARYGSLDAYLDATPIVCKTAAERSIYVSAEGLVFPCCWTANQMYVWYLNERGSPIWKMIDAAGGKDAISALNHPITDIIDGPFFNDIEESWNKSSCKAGKLKVCAKTCGTEFDPFKAQFNP